MRSLETERLILRAIRREDTQTIFENWANDPEVTRYMQWCPHESVDVTHRIMDAWLEDYKNDDCFRYGIERRSDHELMGMIDVVRIDDGVPVIGYCSGKRYWGNGYMTEALNAVLRELFSAGYEAVTISAVKENIGSNRVIQKAGLHLVGTEEGPLSASKPVIVTVNNYRLEKADWLEHNRG